jgi:hypothetical protein
MAVPERSVLLCWSESTAEEQIVVGAEALDEPSTPILEPVFRRQGQLAMAIPITSHWQWVSPHEFFRLVPGHQYANDFSNETGIGWAWSNLSDDPGNPTHTFSEGVYRVQDDQTGRPFMFPNPEPGRTYGNFAASVDIVSWNDADQGIGLYGRAIMPGDATPGLGYCATLAFKSRTFPGHPALVIWVAEPDGTFPNLSAAPVTVPLDSVKGYRLVFVGIGSDLRAELYDLADDSTPLVRVEATDSRFPNGEVGLYVNDYANDPQGIDMTVDNLLITGTAE